MQTETSIRKKMMGSFAAILLVTLILSYNSISVIHLLGSELDKAVNVTGTTVEQVGQLIGAVGEMKAAGSAFILFSSLDDRAQMESNRQSFAEASALMDKMIGELRPRISAGPPAESLRALEAGHKSLAEDFAQMTQFCAAQKCNEALDLYLKQVLPLMAEMGKSASNLRASEHSELASAAAASSDVRARGYWVASILIALALSIGVGVFFVLQRVTGRLHRFAEGMSGSADQMSNAAAQVSSSSQGLAHGAGNLDKVAAAIAGITEVSQKIRHLVEEVNTSSEEQASGIAEVSRAVSEMNEVTQRAAASAEESASAGEEMSSHARSMQVMARELIGMVGAR